MVAPTGFRNDIVFLRCIAIIAVVLYHLRVPHFNDGYVGVDIFFVVSGYLMTKIIVQGLERGTFNLLDFYKRRLLRIYPALLVLILFFFIVLYAVLAVKLYDYSRFALSSSLFVSNVYYYLSSGYFQPASQVNFLLHTWSLSVEWQFYLLYPFVLLAFRANRQRQRNLIYVLTTLSFCAMSYFHYVNTSFAFYMFPTRAWELFVGGIVFMHEDAVKERWPLLIRQVILIGSIVLIVAFIGGVFGTGFFAWPSLFTVIPVLATAGILLANIQFKLFANRLIKFIGNVSYSWYLWHWPLIVLATYFAFDQQSGWKEIIFVLSLVMGTLSYRLVERVSWSPHSRKILALSAAVIVLTFLGTQVPIDRLVWNAEEAKIIRFAHRYPREHAAVQFRFNESHLLSKNAFETFDTIQLLQFASGKKNYLLLGDCHAGMFSHTLQELADKNNVNLLQATGDETFPVPGIQSEFEGPTALMDYMYDIYLPKYHQHIDKVILSANYVGYRKKELDHYFETVENYFKRLQIPVVYIGQTESYNVEFPAVQTVALRFGLDPEKFLQSHRTNANNYLKTSAIADKYVNVYQAAIVQPFNGSETYMYDADHFSTYGTDQFKDVFQQKIFDH